MVGRHQNTAARLGMCDQLRFDHLSCYAGAAAVPTPNIDRLAKLGTRFDNAYVASAVCGPSPANSRASRRA